MRRKEYDLIITPVILDLERGAERQATDEEATAAGDLGCWRIDAVHVSIGAALTEDTRTFCHAYSREIAELIVLALHRVMDAR